METWIPTGLPARFQPRGQARRLRAAATLQRAWLPIAVTATVLVVALVSYTQAPAPAGGATVMQFILGATARAVAAPTPTAIAQRSAPAIPAAPALPRSDPDRQTTAAPVPAVVPLAPEPQATPSPSPAPDPSEDDGEAPPVVAPPAPAPSTTPRICLPVILVCL